MNIHIHVCTPVCTHTRAHTSKERWNEITSKSTRRFFTWSMKDLSSRSEYLLSTFPHSTLEPLPGGCVTATIEGWAFQWVACGDQTLHKLFSITVKGFVANQLRGKSCLSHWLDTWLCARFQPPPWPPRKKLHKYLQSVWTVPGTLEVLSEHYLSLVCKAGFIFVYCQTWTALSWWFHDKSRFRVREMTQSIACLASIRTWVQLQPN